MDIKFIAAPKEQAEPRKRLNVDLPASIYEKLRSDSYTAGMSMTRYTSQLIAAVTEISIEGPGDD